jgi:uncharacterized protein (DUF58 family)
VTALLDSESLKKLPFLSLVARQLGGGILARPRSRLPAGGTELSGHRDYAPGDDLRHVDWNVCARHDELRVRLFQGEADCPVDLLLDCSRSMAAGNPSKFDVARRIVAALAYVALADLEPVGVSAFSDRIVADFGRRRNKASILELVRFIEKLVPAEETTDLASVARAVAGRGRRRGLLVVISDFYDPGGFEAGLDVLRRRGCRPRVVHLYDPREAEPDVLGDSELVDVESGAAWRLTVTEKHLARYRELFAEHHDSVRRYCAGHALGYVRVPLDLAQDELLLRVIGARR